MNSHTALQGAHDVALAVWTGGALMGAIGLDGATRCAFDSNERQRLSAVGWERWTPVAAAAIATHCLLEIVSIAQPIVPGRRRQGGASRLLNAAITMAAVATSAHSDILLGAVQVEQFRATSPGADRQALTRARQRLTVAHWATPALTASLVALRAARAPARP